MTVAVITASNRLFSRYSRHRSFSRLRHNEQELAFLETQANRLSTTVAVVYSKLAKYSAERIAHAVNLAAIP